jgi:kynurenine 3-monooxygenase
MIHELDGRTRFLPYGQRPHELLWSVGRAALNRVLVEAAERRGVEILYEHECTGADFAAGRLQIHDLRARRGFDVPLLPTFGADGAGSALRAAMVRAGIATAREEFLEHGYRELAVPSGSNGEHRMDPGSLHIWPRGGYMLIALPNTDGTFTATLFLSAAGERTSFAALDSADAVTAFFREQFPDVLQLVPDLAAQFAQNPVGRMGTLYAAPWQIEGRALLIGDAAHAIVPFHGQGMNCAFEDCRVIDDLVGGDADWASTFARFDALRRDDTAAIARMALENYVEMRDTVRDPRFALRKEVSLELESRHPERFIPRYSMVMFHSEIPYAEAERRGAVQAQLLEEALGPATRLGDVDWARADAAILERLPPLG